MLKPLSFTPLNLPELLTQAANLPTSGRLANSRDNLCYLDLSDDYIHQLFPFLQETEAQKPDYFGENLVGAHISVIYPEEKRLVGGSDLGQIHHFSIKGAFSADLGAKRYYVLLVNAPSLLLLRKKQGLPDRLAFKDHWIDFHITLGVCSIPNPAL